MPKLLLRSFTTILSITSTTLAQKLSSTMDLLSVTATGVDILKKWMPVG
mgnify:CR=1